MSGQLHDLAALFKWTYQLQSRDRGSVRPTFVLGTAERRKIFFFHTLSNSIFQEEFFLLITKFEDEKIMLSRNVGNRRASNSVIHLKGTSQYIIYLLRK